MRHCEERSDEAIQCFASPIVVAEELDCFAALAMTARHAPSERIPQRERWRLRALRRRFPVIARSTCDEAIQCFASPIVAAEELDCFAALAMTARHAPSERIPKKENIPPKRKRTNSCWPSDGD
jgi:hypothetical protein